LEDFEGFGGQGQDTPLVAFTQDGEAGFGRGEVFELEAEDFAGAQTIEQHESHDG